MHCYVVHPGAWCTHNLFLIESSTAVGGGEGGGTGLAVPWHIAILCAAADWKCVDAVGVAVTVAAVFLPATVTRCPHKDGASPTATLNNKRMRTHKINKRTTPPCSMLLLQSLSDVVWRRLTTVWSSQIWSCWENSLVPAIKKNHSADGSITTTQMSSG